MQVSIAHAVPGHQLVLTNAHGAVLARAPAQGYVALGPFPIAANGETLRLEIDDGSHFALQRNPAIAPYAYYTRSVE